MEWFDRRIKTTRGDEQVYSFKDYIFVVYSFKSNIEDKTKQVSDRFFLTNLENKFGK